jgi:hypothetical protein
MSEVYMTNRVTMFLMIATASIVAGASIAPIVVSTTEAAEECLVKPKDGTPPGQHWYYRVDRNTKRQCWYLRDKDDASSQAVVPTPTEKNASLDRKNDGSLTLSTGDAFAALSSPRARIEGRAPVQPAAQTPSSDATDEQASARDDLSASGQSPVASRWPDSTGVLSPAIERPAATALVAASVTPDPAADDANASGGISPVVDTPSPAISLQMLLAAFAAFAVSGLTGGAIYFARVRRRPLPDEATSRVAGWSPPDDDYRLYAPRRQAGAVTSPRGPETRSVERLTSGLTENGQEIAQLLARFAPGAER